MSKKVDDDDFLALPAAVTIPKSGKGSRPGQSKALKLPVDVEVPEGMTEDEKKDWWPYPLPGRDNMGRPRNIETAERFDELVVEYFSDCHKRTQRPTMTGMQLHLGLSHSSMNDYMKKPEFSSSVSQARNMIKNSYEHNLVRSQGSVQGVIFALKSFGRDENDFVDTTRNELSGPNGQPIRTLNGNIDLEAMSGIEKASRLLSILTKAKNEGNTIDVTPTEDDEDYLL